ncbi:MAG: hypothetical protein AMXMBFR84_24900 [Candidatus Hydrogenedentota bacterium]
MVTVLVAIHVVISLVALALGVPWLYGMIVSQRRDRLTFWFLATTLGTSLSGFILPADRILPSHIVGLISVVVIAVAYFAWYVRKSSGFWRPIFVITAVFAFYLNAFVFVVQAFLKVPVLKALAPTQSEPPFLVAQLVVLVVFLGVGTIACIRFRPVAAAV